MASEQPIVSGMAGRYATALFELALEEKALDEVRADLDRFDALIAELGRPGPAGAQPGFRRRRAGQGARPGARARPRSTAFAANFLKLVASNRRLFAVRDMIRAFRALVAAQGRGDRQVTVAEPLSDAHLAALKSALKT